MTKALVITCMDYRFVNVTQQRLRELGYDGDYDLLTVAGASLSYEPMVVHESNFLKEYVDYHIEVAMKLHDIQEVIIIDHKDCGAYKLRYGAETIARSCEKEMHKTNCENMHHILKRKFPTLRVSSYYVSKDSMQCL